MSVKMRLTRHGRKRYAFYHIVIADSRAPRDGRYIERIGSYNPNTNPATIDLDFDSAYEWLLKGAQPTDTVRNILSYKGVLYKKHLMGGVKKGAFDEAEAERRLDAWMTEKENQIQEKVDSLLSKEEAENKKRLEAEAKVNEERLAAIRKRDAELAAELEAKAVAAAKEAAGEDVQEEVAADEAETTNVEAQATEEVKAEEPKEENVSTEEDKKAE